MIRKFFCFVIFSFFLMPFSVLAINDVGYNLGKYECTSKYQDRNVSTMGVAYFSHCISYYKENNKCVYEYVDSEKVNCLNGNKDPYFEPYKDGCKSSECSKALKYCSVIIKYDCSKKRNGESFVTSTKNSTKATTKPKTTTTSTTTTTQKIVSTKLKTLSLSNGTINFSSDIYEYNISLNEEISSIEVYSVPEDESCNVSVLNNYNLVDGSIIKVVVTSPDNNTSEYLINVKKEKTLSSNANLKELTIVGHDISFNSNIKEYSVTIDEGEILDINYVVEDEKSVVEITNNENLTNESTVVVSVTAEDGITMNYYYINIDIEEKSNVFSVLFIIIFVLALGAGGYYLYKKFFGKSGEKYEYE